MNVAVDAIPVELRAEKRFVVWKHELVGGKPKKTPYRIDFARRASSTEPDDWTTLEEALDAVEWGVADGIGYALPARVYTLVDLDDVLDGAGELHSHAAAIIGRLDSYSEWSQSDEGVHCIVRGRLGGRLHQTKDTPWGGKFEAWDRARFVYLTGKRVHATPENIEERQAQLDDVVAHYLPAAAPTPPRPPHPVALDDQELLERAFAAKNGARFAELWHGNTSAYNGDDSAADQALCNLLAFWTGRDPARIDALFRSSGLMRDKWERADYRERTIAKAIVATTEVYTPPRSHDASRPDRNVVDAGDGLQRPYALPLDEFIAARSDLPAALLGDSVETILAALGLVILFGRGGRGKTTLTIEASLHLASGIAWLVFAVGRPLRILLIENEGPRELFREKLERRLASWPHELTGAIFVYTERWGAFTLAGDEGEAIERLRAFIADNRIDLVIGDPLDTLGVAGVGSPEQTRDFAALMVAAGLGRDVAFWLLHHPRKERADDELDELSGAWGGKPDTVMRLDVKPGDRARLSFPKIRWRRRALRPPLILAFDPATESYSVVGEEGEERDLVAEIEELLADDEWRTAKEIAAPKDAEPPATPGIGADVKAVKPVLEEHPDRFESRTGEEAAALGRRRDAVLWQKRSWASNTHNSDPASQGAKERSGVQRQASIEDAELNSAPFAPETELTANSAPLDEAPDETCVQAPCTNPRAPGSWYCVEHGGES